MRITCGDIDAELAQTLHELEERPKSNVIPLTIRESARPQPQSAAVPEIFVAPESLLLAPSVEAPAAPDAAHSGAARDSVHSCSKRG